MEPRESLLVDAVQQKTGKWQWQAGKYDSAHRCEGPEVSPIPGRIDMNILPNCLASAEGSFRYLASAFCAPIHLGAISHRLVGLITPALGTVSTHSGLLSLRIISIDLLPQYLHHISCAVVVSLLGIPPLPTLTCGRYRHSHSCSIGRIRIRFNVPSARCESLGKTPGVISVQTNDWSILHGEVFAATSSSVAFVLLSRSYKSQECSPALPTELTKLTPLKLDIRCLGF